MHPLQRQHLSRRKIANYAENGKLCGDVRRNLSNCAVFCAADLVELCESCAGRGFLQGLQIS